MLAMFWLGGYWAAAILSTPRSRLRRLLNVYWIHWSATLLALFAVGLFYLWTLSTGAWTTVVGRTDSRNVLFILYELFGFSGPGPGHIDVRNTGLSVLLPWIPGLVGHAAALSAVFWLGCKRILSEWSARTGIMWLLPFVAVFGLILAAGVSVKFRLLGRHCTPALPLVLFALGNGIAALSGKKKAGPIIVAAFLAATLLSALNPRFSERHVKDDYRDAAGITRKALLERKSVWWVADLQGALVYHVPVARDLDNHTANSAETALLLKDPSEEFLKALPAPEMVVASKPDVYDGFGAVRGYIESNNYHVERTLPAFTTWRRGDALP